LERARATALLAKGRDERARKLLPSSAVSQDEADARQATYAQSEADVLNAEAAVDLAQLNL
jgi:multidrug efflux system membrane fusion protein